MALTRQERVDIARAAVDYLTSRTADELATEVPNCPGWTVYNAAVHVARVCAAWGEMMTYPPDEPDARDKAYAAVDELPHGVEPSELARWAHGAIDEMAGDDERECYFSMTGGLGTTALWAWHAASEIGVHRLDVEAALGNEHHLSAEQAADALTYACTYFLPAMRKATGEDPGAVTFDLRSSDGAPFGQAAIQSSAAASVTLAAKPLQALLAVWGRPHIGVEVIEGDRAVFDRWSELPGEAFQFGTWE